MTDKKVPQNKNEKPATTEYVKRSKEPVNNKKNNSR